MPTATNYQFLFGEIDDYLGFMDTATSALDTTMENLGNFLDVPGDLERQLRNPAEAMDLPDFIVQPLSFLPFGIGTAISTINRIGDTASDILEDQADAMGLLDDAWAPFRTVNTVLETVNSANGLFIDGLALENGQRLNEADLLADSLGDQEIHEGSLLGARMAAASVDAQAFVDQRDALLTPVINTANQIRSFVDDFIALIPDTTVVQNVLDGAQAVFDPLADAVDALENALFTDIVIVPEVNIPRVLITPGFTIPGIPNPFGGWITPPIYVPPVYSPAIYTPAVTVNVGEALSDLGNAVGIVQDFVENTVLSVLDAIGIDILGAANSLASTLLGPLQPIFDLFDRLVDGAQGLIDIIEGLMADFRAGMEAIFEEMREIFDIGSLFESRMEGDDTAETLEGSALEDAIFGLGADDMIFGRAGVDFLFGGDGHDMLNGGLAGDELFGGEGDDELIGSGGFDLLDGGAGNDRLVGGDGNDILIGGAGADVMNGGQGADEMDGGDGADIMNGQGGGDTMSGGAGDDRMSGNAGNDTMNGDAGDDDMNGGLGNDTMNGGDGADTMSGGNGSDTMNGDAGDDTINGNAGSDTLDGGDGMDFLSGGQGNDVVDGGAGDDTVRGDTGADTLYGGAGNDMLFGGGGNDRLEGEAGDDIYVGGAGADVFVFSTGTDRIDDFSLMVDELVLSGEALGISGSEVGSIFDEVGSVVDGSVVLDFGEGNSLTLVGVGNLNLLEDNTTILV